MSILTIIMVGVEIMLIVLTMSGTSAIGMKDTSIGIGVEHTITGRAPVVKLVRSRRRSPCVFLARLARFAASA